MREAMGPGHHQGVIGVEPYGHLLVVDIAIFRERALQLILLDILPLKTTPTVSCLSNRSVERVGYQIEQRVCPCTRGNLSCLGDVFIGKLVLIDASGDRQIRSHPKSLT